MTWTRSAPVCIHKYRHTRTLARQHAVAVCRHAQPQPGYADTTTAPMNAPAPMDSALFVSWPFLPLHHSAHACLSRQPCVPPRCKDKTNSHPARPPWIAFRRCEKDRCAEQRSQHAAVAAVGNRAHAYRELRVCELCDEHFRGRDERPRQRKML